MRLKQIVIFLFIFAIFFASTEVMPESIGYLRLYGDINSDGKINGIDLLLLKKHILGSEGFDLKDDDLIYADVVTHNGNPNGLSLLLLKKYILGLVNIWDLQPSTSVAKEGEWRAYYYRYGLDSDDYRPKVTKIKTKSDLSDFIEQNKPYYYHKFVDEILFNKQRYNEAFFRDKSLLLVSLYEGSGSFRHKVTSVKNENGVLQINIDCHIPFLGTDDEAYWIIAIETDKDLAELETAVSTRTVYMDTLALSAPAKALSSVEFTGNRRIDGTYEHLSAICFTFEGEHTMFMLDAMSEYGGITRDGIKLTGKEIGINGDDYEYKRIFTGIETRFFVRISPKQNKPGVYVFSGSYAGVPFETPPAAVVQNGPSIREQSGLGGIATDDIVKIKFLKQYSDLQKTRFWETADSVLISELLNYIDQMEGTRIDTQEFGEFYLSIHFVLKNGAEIPVSVNTTSNFNSGMMDADRHYISYTLTNAKSPEEWEVYLNKCERLQ